MEGSTIENILSKAGAWLLVLALSLVSEGLAIRAGQQELVYVSSG